MAKNDKNTVVRELRAEHGWSMDELAEKLGTTISTVNRIEKGETPLISHWVEGLAAAFGLSERQLIERLLGEPAPEPPHGMAESSARPYVPADAPELERIPLKPGEERWTIHGNDLSAIGLNDGDVVIIDMTQTATDSIATGDAAVIQVVDLRDFTKGATHLRQFIEPHLFIPNSLHANPGPWFDRRTQDVRVKGIITKRYSTEFRPTRRP